VCGPEGEVKEAELCTVICTCQGEVDEASGPYNSVARKGLQGRFFFFFSSV
jgi:hypothetical protein